MHQSTVCVHVCMDKCISVLHVSIYRWVIPYMHGADTGVVALCYFRSIL